MTVVYYAGVVVSLLSYHASCLHSCPNLGNRLRLGARTLHLHHWLLSIIALLIIAFVPVLRSNGFIKGLLVGGFVHGLTYDDWDRVLY